MKTSKERRLPEKSFTFIPEIGKYIFIDPDFGNLGYCVFVFSILTDLQIFEIVLNFKRLNAKQSKQNLLVF